jgi:AcrR family transcriptional regulator
MPKTPKPPGLTRRAEILELSHPMARGERASDSAPGGGESVSGPLSLRERQKRQRRLRMLEAASSLFNERGYENVTIEEIAQHADVSSATVHNYYASKGRLLLAIVERGDEAILAHAAQISRTPCADAEEVLNAMLEHIARHSLEYLDHKVWRHAIAISISRDDPDYGTGFAEVHKRFIVAIEEVVEALKRAGALAVDINARVMASVLYKVHHALFVEMIGDTTVDFKRYCVQQHSHVAMILAAATDGRRLAS